MEHVKGGEPDELAGRLVDEAARLLAEHGPAALSLRRVAAAAGTSTMAVYTRFGDKARMLTAMHREGFRRLGAMLTDVAPTADPLADLLAMGLAYRRAALASRHLYELMFAQPVAKFTPDEPGRRAADAAYRPLVDAVRRCQDSGVFTGHDPERVALHLWSVAHGMVSLELHGHLAPDEAEHRYGEALGFAGAPFLT